MLSRLRSVLVGRSLFCTSYNQKNHKKDFTANRIHEKFIGIYLDYMQMDPKNYDQRLVVNIYLKAFADNNTEMIDRTLLYILANVDKVDNLMTISNIVRNSLQLKQEFDLTPLYQAGLKIMQSNLGFHDNDLNSTFKNFDPGSVRAFISVMISSRYKQLLSKPENYKIIEDISFIFGPYYLTVLTEQFYNAGFQNYVKLLVGNLYKIRKICNPEGINMIKELYRKTKHPTLKKIFQDYNGTLHRSEFSFQGGK